ncbi:MAG TPA: winged helix-turn-helix transcriptional regulator [Candidatus Woesearchaeota archaeon]|nr:winged helix-turn-helix transcriptional regulator [Candidatus Woesearchaeota archaeon]
MPKKKINESSRACLYYDANENIIEILPMEIEPALKDSLAYFWGKEVSRKILKHLSKYECAKMQDIRKDVGHSSSTVHEYLHKMEKSGIVELEKVYKGKKEILVKPKAICVTKNKRFKQSVSRFFQGLWVNSEKMNRIILLLHKNSDKFFTSEEISAKTSIPVDEVELLLSNWDSKLTRAVSDLTKEPPFEKRTVYRAMKGTSLKKE